jgi:hypothetical protein
MFRYLPISVLHRGLIIVCHSSKPRINGLAFQSQYAEDAPMDTSERFMLGETMQCFSNMPDSSRDGLVHLILCHFDHNVEQEDHPIRIQL